MKVAKSQRLICFWWLTARSKFSLLTLKELLRLISHCWTCLSRQTKIILQKNVSAPGGVTYLKLNMSYNYFQVWDSVVLSISFTPVAEQQARNAHPQAFVESWGSMCRLSRNFLYFPYMPESKNWSKIETRISKIGWKYSFFINFVHLLAEEKLFVHCITHFVCYNKVLVQFICGMKI